MKNFTSIVIEDSNPELIVRDYCKKLLASQEECHLLLVSYPFSQYWLQHDERLDSVLTPAKEITLTAIYFICSQTGGEIKVAVCNDNETTLNETMSSELQQSTAKIDEQYYLDFCTRYSLAHFSSHQLLKLNPISIVKPWGQEIWYTGIEQRGVAMATNNGLDTPLPWVLSALPGALCGQQQQSLILLKILDPVADKMKGDLYFELHQEKREVYVVTSIDEQAWPGGKGAMRYGFDQAKRGQFVRDNDFKTAFQQAVQSYEKIRRKIDSRNDQNLALKAIDQGVDSAVASPDIEEIPISWVAEESRLRQQMEAFTAQLTLTVGDVVKVPCLTPHSLQHGVRTIEFQTPVYERLIISFNQKVETQAHWDTATATTLMNLDDIEQEPSFSLITQQGLAVERIVEFEDFDVLRVKLDVYKEYVVKDIDSYCLLIAIQGVISVKENKLIPEEAALLSKSINGAKIVVEIGKSACFLLAYPK